MPSRKSFVVNKTSKFAVFDVQGGEKNKLEKGQRSKKKSETYQGSKQRSFLLTVSPKYTPSAHPSCKVAHTVAKTRQKRKRRFPAIGVCVAAVASHMDFTACLYMAGQGAHFVVRDPRIEHLHQQ